MIGLLAALCLFQAGINLAAFVEGDPGKMPWAVGLWIPLAVGLWLAQWWARWLAVILLWLFIALVSLAPLHPLLNDTEPQQSIEAALLFMLPKVIVAIYGLHVLGKYKAAFHGRQQK